MKTFHLAKRYLSFRENFLFHNLLFIISCLSYYLSALQNFFACRLLSGELHCIKFPRHLFIIESQEIICTLAVSGCTTYGSTGSGVFILGVQTSKEFCQKINIWNYWILRIGFMGMFQKLDIILESKVIWNLMLSKNVNNKKCAP